jgi:hypothetical protein
VAPGSIPIEVNATTPIGTIESVAYWANTNLIAVETNAPYEFTWNESISNTFVLTAVATSSVGLASTSAPVSIIVTFPPPGPAVFTLSSNAYSVPEDAGSVSITILKSLNSFAGTVNYSTVNGTAVAFNQGFGNYQRTAGNLSFGAGDTSKVISIPIINNSIYQGNTSFNFVLAPSDDGSTTGSPYSAPVTIIDGHQPGPDGSLLQQAYPNSTPLGTGQLVVNLTPPEAGGRWRFPWDQTWRTNGEQVSNLPQDNYPIELEAVPGYLAAPMSQTVGVTNGGITIATSQYFPTLTATGVGTGSLTVNISPQNVLADGAAWQIYGVTDMLASGATATNLLPNTYFILFSPVANWSTPAELAVTVTAGESQTVTATYEVPEQLPSNTQTPIPVPSANITDFVHFPYFCYNGELQTDVGYGSGVVVAQNVVLTAAHMVFNDENLSYVSQAYWSFEQEYRDFGPDPLPARGWYVLSGYAAQRTNDLPPIGSYGVDQSSPKSRNLDVAALYFLTAAGAGGYGGYLASDAVPNQWLASSPQSFVVGYPVDGSAFGQTVTPYLMYHTQATASAFSQENNDEVYLTSAFLSYPGNSGGPVYVPYSNGSNYPAAVYLGTVGTGTESQTAVRAIDSNVVALITRAAIDGDSGTNNSGGGVITIIPDENVTSNPAFLQFSIAPPAAVAAGAGWRLAGDQSYGSGQYTRLINTTNIISVQFNTNVPGWIAPPSRALTVTPGAVVNYPALYSVVNPTLTHTAAGIGIIGTTNTSYQIQSTTSLNGGVWGAVTNAMITNSGFNLVLTPPTNPPSTIFYRALWLTNSSLNP